MEDTNISVINNVKIWTDENGIEHFQSFDGPKSHQSITLDNRSTWQKICDWWNDAHITPYIKTRDLSDPFGDRKNDPTDDGNESKSGTEIGVKISF
jgi:hypothetical protein